MTISYGWTLALVLAGAGAVLFRGVSMGGSDAGELAGPLKSVTAQQGCGLTFRIPETWNQIAEPPKDNLTFAPPDTPHLRLWVSSLTAPIEPEAGEKPADIETLAARLVKNLPVNDGSLQYEVRRLDANRAVISYELHLDAIAPQYVWWLIERQGNTLCGSLFTLSVYADQFRSDETRRLVAVLGQEVAAATHGPAAQASVQAGAAGAAGGSAAWQAAERLAVANRMATLTEANLPAVADHVLAIAADFQSRVSAPLKPLGTQTQVPNCLVFSMAVHTTWLQGTRIGLGDPISPNESALWRATLAIVGRASPRPEETAALRAEIEGLSSSGLSAFAAPPEAWVSERLTTLQTVLERRTGQAALILRRILGPVVLEPVQPEVGRPYYRARTSLDVLALLEPDPEETSEPGSSVLRRWSQRESNPCSRRERPVS